MRRQSIRACLHLMVVVSHVRFSSSARCNHSHNTHSPHTLHHEGSSPSGVEVSNTRSASEACGMRANGPAEQSVHRWVQRRS